MNVELIFGEARRDETRSVAHGVRNRVGRSNPDSVVNGFRGFEVLWHEAAVVLRGRQGRRLVYRGALSELFGAACEGHMKILRSLRRLRAYLRSSGWKANQW